jgi:primary-amine oxidase
MDHASQKRVLPITAVFLFCGILYLLISNSNLFGTYSGPFSPPEPTDFQAPKRNVWAELTADEADELFDFLYNVPNNLNLTKIPTGSSWENTVRSIELLQPNKSDIVSYLDHSAGAPSRWAHVVVGEKVQPRARAAHYMVGPLNQEESMTALPLTYWFNSGRNYMNVSSAGDLDVMLFMLSVASNISDITMDLLGAKVDPHKLPFLDQNGLIPFMRKVKSEDDNYIYWTGLLRVGGTAGEWGLLPQGIYFKFETLGRDSKDWRTLQWAYNGVLYDSEKAFRAAWRSPDFVKLLPSLPGSWSRPEDLKANSTANSLPPPSIAQVQNWGFPRYRLDVKQGYVSWMGFTFYLASNLNTGLSLFDIQFNSTRIIYSIGLQEALSHYAGSDPIHGSMYWFDALFGMGLTSELVPGYDCPAHADFLNTTFYTDDEPIIIHNGICIFEYIADHPISRHSSYSSTTATHNTYLIARTVTTVGNYDYTIDFVFYLDGTVEVKYRASGYILAAFYPPFSAPLTSPNQSSMATPNEYGYHIHDAISSSVHTHVLNFRADLDIAGPLNTLSHINISPHTSSFPWDQPEHATRNTMHLTTTPVDTERALNWHTEDLYVILNNDSVNAWGEKRGYRIMPGTMPGVPAHLAIINSTALGNSARWAESDLFVLRHHNNELASSVPMSWFSPEDPLIDFSKMLNNESTIQEDLVVYFNLGNHHVPTTQDIPNTLMHTSGSSVMFTPFNYFDREISGRRASSVAVDRSISAQAMSERRLRQQIGFSN